MKVTVQKLFEKDINKIRDVKIANHVSVVIEEMEHATKLIEVKNIKKMTAKGNYYRVRIGDYRLGFKVDGKTIVLLRFVHRKDIYSYFP